MSTSSLQLTKREKLRIAALERLSTPKGRDQLARAAARAAEARTGSKHSEETKEKMRKAHKERLKDPAVKSAMMDNLEKGWKSTSPNGGRAIKGKPKSREHVEKIKRNRAKQVFPLKDSKPEKLVQEYLSEINVPYEKHYIVSGLGLHQWDLAIPEKNLLVEVDGCYWHGCEECFPELTTRQAERKEKDRLLTSRAENKGWTVVRLWEHDILEGNINLKGCFRRD